MRARLVLFGFVALLVLFGAALVSDRAAAVLLVVVLLLTAAAVGGTLSRLPGWVVWLLLGSGGGR